MSAVTNHEQERVNHPQYYGGGDNPYEAIKVIEHHNWNFAMGSAHKYMVRAGKKEGDDELVDLRKAKRYLEFEIARRERLRDSR